MDAPAALALERERGLANVALHLAATATIRLQSEEMTQILRYAAALPVPLHAGMKEEVEAAVRTQSGAAPAAPWLKRPAIRVATRCP